MPGRKKRRIEARSKLWVACGEKIIFGEGRARILEAVMEHGSLNRAAKALKMSYRAVWGKINATEKVLAFKLVESASIRKGGGSRLTQQGNDLLKAFRNFKADSLKAVDSCFKKTIGRLPKM
jgi:molybdate transport system regulatory protein